MLGAFDDPASRAPAVLQVLQEPLVKSVGGQVAGAFQPGSIVRQAMRRFEPPAPEDVCRDLRAFLGPMRAQWVKRAKFRRHPVEARKHRDAPSFAGDLNFRQARRASGMDGAFPAWGANMLKSWASRLCRKLLPLRGMPVMKIGLTIGCRRISGYCRSCSRSRSKLERDPQHVPSGAAIRPNKLKSAALSSSRSRTSQRLLEGTVAKVGSSPSACCDLRQFLAPQRVLENTERAGKLVRCTERSRLEIAPTSPPSDPCLDIRKAYRPPYSSAVRRPTRAPPMPEIPVEMICRAWQFCLEACQG